MSKALVGCASILAIAVAIGTCPAKAQVVSADAPSSQESAAETEAQEVVVTGSRIARRDYVAQSPIVTANQEAIAQAGTPTIDAYLRQLPQFRPGSGDFSNNSAGGTVGQSTLNLRGLGAARNLVLLDGRRLQPSDGNGAIDINTIPTLAVGSTEVISGGASATYGSDAVSGVVNFKLRTDLRGLVLSAQANVSEDGDAGSQQIGIAYGKSFAGGRGRILLSAEYMNRAGLRVLDRDFFLNTNASGFMPQGNVNPDANNLPSQAAVNAVFTRYGTTAAVARTASFFANSDGSLFIRGTTAANTINYRGPTTLPFISNASFFGYHGSYYNYIRSPLERTSLFGRAEYEIIDGVTAYAQALYSHGRALNIGSEAILAAGFDLFVPANNPFIPADLAQILASRPNPTARFQYADRIEQVGPRIYQSTTDLYQLLAGLRGDIASGGLTWDVYYSYGQSTVADRTIAGAVSVSALNRLTQAADGGRGLCSGGYNPFGLQPLSAACVAYISRAPVNTTKLTQNVVEATLGGNVIELPGGMSKFALTGAYRDNSYLFVPDADIAAGDIATIASTTRTAGKIAVKEAAAELLLPLLSNVPLIRSLNVTLGYRYSDYNLSGGVHTYKADFDWRVARPLLLRGGYQQAIRAPNISEFFQARTQIIQGIGNSPGAGDPCDIRSGARTGASAAQVRSLCIATGLPAALADSYRISTGSIITNLQGNAALSPEKAKTWTIGAVITSPFDAPALRGASLTIDYYNIRISNAIATLDALTVLQKCYNIDGSNPTYSATNSFCQQVSRPTGNDPFVFRPTLNLGAYRTSGVDIQFNWRVPVAAIDGAVTLDSYANYLDRFSVQTLPGAAFQNFAGTIAAGNSYPRWSLVNALTIDSGPIALTGRWRHIVAMRDSSVVTNPASTTLGTPAYDYFDLSARIAAAGGFDLRLGVNNLTDKQPPIVGGLPGVTNLGVYDAVGRSVFAGVQAKF